MFELLKTTMQNIAIEFVSSTTVSARLAPFGRGVLASGLCAVFAASLLADSANAGSIYRCQSSSGVIEYSNSRPADSAGKHCETLDLPEITTIPAPSMPQKKAPAKASAKGSGDFPKVSAARQQRRDNARKEILRDELDRERARLGKLREEFQDGEPERLGNERNYQKYLDRVERLRGDISRRESNIAALQRELEDLNN